jgi:hypothetical protein
LLESSNQPRFIVLVAYGAADMAQATAKISKYVGAYGATLVEVDTSIDRDGFSINEAFEFSGYQYGIRQVCSHIEQTRPEFGCDQVVQVIVLNSTVFSAHISLLCEAFFRLVFSDVFPDSRDSTVVALRWEASGPTQKVAKLGWYFATNIFAVTASVRVLQSVAFFDRSEVARFHEGGFCKLPPEYNGAVERWLAPRSLFGGWYKADPFSRLPSSEMVRKRIAIYLEHSLPERLVGSGFKFEFPNREGVASVRRLFQLVIFMDRIFVNILKISNRLRGVIANRFAAA